MKKQTDNKGYSLVEIMVVIALIAIGATISAISLSVIFSTNVRETAVNIDSFISKGIVSANYRRPVVYIAIRNDGSNILADYYEGSEVTSPVRTEKMGSGRVQVTLVETAPDGTVTETAVTASDSILLAFDRRTGEISKVIQGTSDITLVKFDDLSPYIRLGSGTSGNYIIDLVPLTGGHSVRRN